MKRPPRKPSGTDGAIKLDATGVHFEKIDFPNAKDGVEQHVADSFIASTGNPYFSISSITKNQENDLDFLIETSKGKKFLELMEIAPLEGLGGSYDKAPSSYKPYDLARFVKSHIQKKSNKYHSGKLPKIVLLVYTTDWRFAVSETTICILQHWLATSSHSFEYVYLHHPTKPIGITHVLYPTPKEYWDAQNFDPEAYRENITHLFAPESWVIVPHEG